MTESAKTSEQLKKKNEVRVSLIMPVFNRPGYTDAAIGSVRDQDATDFELLIYDDGSEQATKDLLRKHADEDPRIRLFEGQHVGPVLARMHCHDKARGKYVGWIDSDDLLMPTCLRETSDFLDSNPECGLVYTHHLSIDGSGSEAGVARRTTIPYSRKRLLVDFMVFHFRLIRREAYEAVGGLDPSFEVAHDYDLVLRISEQTTIRHLARPLYVYRRHSENISIVRRVEQIDAAARAVRSALSRRGMDSEYRLEVQISERFRLLRQHKATDP